MPIMGKCVSGEGAGYPVGGPADDGWGGSED